jgi:hypothetical protein
MPLAHPGERPRPLSPPPGLDAARGSARHDPQPRFIVCDRRLRGLARRVEQSEQRREIERQALAALLYRAATPLNTLSHLAADGAGMRG